MPDAVEYFNRYSGQLETEKIYGEKPLRWVYETRLGRLTLEAVVKRPWMSAFYGWLMDRPSTRQRVQPFISEYDVDASEFADPPETFQSFNEFFYRRLKPEARPICSGANEIAFPADGRHLAIPDLSDSAQFFVKGQRFDLAKLLRSSERASRYAGGVLVLSRLCPVDYHRVHFAVSGVASEPELMNGFLYAVNPVALRRNLGYLWQNKRVMTEIETKSMGTVIQFEFGATNVGSINQCFTPGPVRKGDEKSYFAFGGSAVMTLFERGRVSLADDLLQQSSECRELYARMGDVMATTERS